MSPNAAIDQTGFGNGRARVLAVAGITLFVDQMSKSIAVEAFADESRQWGPLHPTLIRNSGGPFGLASGASLFWTAVTVTGTLALLIVATTGRWSAAPALAVGALAGGAAGNLVDRIVRAPGSGRGAVVDWIVVDPYPRVFNIADVALRGGAVVLLVSLIFGGQTVTGSLQRT